MRQCVHGRGRSGIAGRFLRVRNTSINELPLGGSLVPRGIGEGSPAVFVITESKLKAKIWRGASFVRFISRVTYRATIMDTTRIDTVQSSTGGFTVPSKIAAFDAEGSVFRLCSPSSFHYRPKRVPIDSSVPSLNKIYSLLLAQSLGRTVCEFHGASLKFTLVPGANELAAAASFRKHRETVRDVQRRRGDKFPVFREPSQRQSARV